MQETTPIQETARTFWHLSWLLTSILLSRDCIYMCNVETSVPDFHLVHFIRIFNFKVGLLVITAGSGNLFRMRIGEMISRISLANKCRTEKPVNGRWISKDSFWNSCRWSSSDFWSLKRQVENPHLASYVGQGTEYTILAVYKGRAGGLTMELVNWPNFRNIGHYNHNKVNYVCLTLLFTF